MKDQIENYQYLFVGGIFGEILELPFIGQYFLDNKKILMESGAKHVSIFTPSSLLSTENSAKSLAKKVGLLFQKNKLPLVLFTHSKGALDALYMILQNPDLVKDGTVFKVVLMHGALNGSPIADKILVGSNRSKGFFKFTKKSVRSILSVYPAANSLTSIHAARTQSLIETIKTQEGDNFFMKYFMYLVGGKSKTEKTLPIVALTHTYLTRSVTVSDGLTVLESQILPSMKLRTFYYRADHGEYLVSSILGNKLRANKTLFTLDLLNLVFSNPVTYVQEAPENETDLLGFLTSRLQ